MSGLGQMKQGDTAKAVQKIYDLAELSDPPMRLALGKDAIKYVREQQESVASDIAKFESWSKDLQMD